MTADPLEVHSPGESGEANLYSYLSGAALKNVDPLGLCGAEQSCGESQATQAFTDTVSPEGRASNGSMQASPSQAAPAPTAREQVRNTAALGTGVSVALGGGQAPIAGLVIQAAADAFVANSDATDADKAAYGTGLIIGGVGLLTQAVGEGLAAVGGTAGSGGLAAPAGVALWAHALGVAANGVAAIGAGIWMMSQGGGGGGTPPPQLPEHAGPTGHISPTDVVGKTPAQIDARAKELGLIPKGEDPAQGLGSYIDPVTKKPRILSHPNDTKFGPHGHVNAPDGKQRIGPGGAPVPNNSPEAHLPTKKQ